MGHNEHVEVHDWDAKGVSVSGDVPQRAIRYDPLVGGEAVPIDLRVARIGSRAVAYFLDFIAELLAFGFLTGVINNLPLEAAARIAISIALTVLVFVGYPVILETAWSGRTLGKAAMGLAAARDDGGPLRFRHALVRALLWIFADGFVTLGIAGVVTSMMSERGKRIGDYLAGTVVLQVRVPQTGAYVPPMPPPLAGWATTLDLSRFSDTLALQSRQFLGRIGQLNPEARERLGASLVAAIGAVVAPAPPPGTPGWAYVTAVLAERRRREELRLRTGPVAAPATPAPLPHLMPLPLPPPPPAHPTPSRVDNTGGFTPPA